MEYSKEVGPKICGVPGDAERPFTNRVWLVPTLQVKNALKLMACERVSVTQKVPEKVIFRMPKKITGVGTSC